MPFDSPQSSSKCTLNKISSSRLRTNFIQPKGHKMPTPIAGRWSSDNLPWTMNNPHLGVVEFNGSVTFNEPRQHGFKRKSELCARIPTKQFITDERMAAHINGLHISCDYKSHSSPNNVFESDFDELDDTMDLEMGELSNETSDKTNLMEKLKNNGKIYVPDEVFKLSEDPEPILPKAILEQIEKPCLAVVLWQPPLKITDLATKADSNEDSSDNEEVENQQQSINGHMLDDSQIDIEWDENLTTPTMYPNNSYMDMDLDI